MKINFCLYIWLLLVLVACSREPEKISFNDDTFVDLLFDLHVAKKAVSTESLYIRDSILRIYTQNIAERYSTDTSSINKNIALMLKKDPEKMIELMDSVNRRIEEALDEIQLKD